MLEFRKNNVCNQFVLIWHHVMSLHNIDIRHLCVIEIRFIIQIYHIWLKYASNYLHPTHKINTNRMEQVD